MLNNSSALALEVQLEQELNVFTNQFNFEAKDEDDLGPTKFSVDVFESFEQQQHQDKILDREKRSCPSGVGNFGFNSFNFLTFMVLVFNAVANTVRFIVISRFFYTSILINMVF